MENIEPCQTCNLGRFGNCGKCSDGYEFYNDANNCNISDVSQQRELLIDFMHYLYGGNGATDYVRGNALHRHKVDDFLKSINCG